ncbi:helix-turn-helix domain-containing protein [Sphingomonas sp. BN140010]|uniref:Helix-turn-helix domain-containing protein n=1 Tax=Sphingomonas arvum TaxID=2992113 RepID=A0ABT3JDR4_9SPHN|nr:helix-turn-helix domain-containing protein [Sphingomonas sp. BN140010]MCW3797208.1 helix-turn-helix domain-containing protein [Sphingomonas sp. BN140010]
MIYACPPATDARARFEGPAEELQFFVPVRLLERLGCRCSLEQLRDKMEALAKPSVDPLAERLAMTLLQNAASSCEAQTAFVRGLEQAIVARLLWLSEMRVDGQPGQNGLLHWRLKRVLNLIETHLGEPLRLADLAAAAGLSRMHFAAQFRRSLGVSPHEYLVRRRVERAQELLRETDLPLVEVALTVGFQNQAHFTTVFRRQADLTPGRWRQQQQLFGQTQPGKLAA